MERRNAGDVAAVERTDGGTPKISGYAAVFGEETNIAGMFNEVISRSAFDNVLGDDVRALVDHNPEKIFGRTKAGTLRLEVDERGLRYEADIPDTQVGRDLVENIRVGNISQSSFGFSIDEEVWEERDGDLPLRKITRLAKLYDVSPVTFPAYEGTEVSLRKEARKVLDNAGIRGQSQKFEKALKMKIGNDIMARRKTHNIKR